MTVDLLAMFLGYESGSTTAQGVGMYKQRVAEYRAIELARSSKCIAYVTGDRRGLETQIHEEVLPILGAHLDAIGPTERISLYLYTVGGHTLAAWSIANLIRQYCDDFEVIIPAKALSAGTLISLGADRILMTKQATLGPVDPSVSTPLNPTVPGGPPEARVPVSVEAINGFIDLAREMGVSESRDRAAVLCALTAHVHPLVLGEAYRARAQIKMLARMLLSMRKDRQDNAQIDKVVSFLCSESGSHDYTIYRKSARDDLGLPVEDADNWYETINSVYSLLASELELSDPFNHQLVLGSKDTCEYRFVRAVVESPAYGSHRYVSRGRLNTVDIPPQPDGIIRKGIQDQRVFEGWEHEQP